MDKKQLNSDLCAILTTLDEVPYAPESVIYLALGADLARFERAKLFLTSSGLAVSYGSAMSITEAGKQMAHKINEFAKRA